MGTGAGSECSLERGIVDVDGILLVRLMSIQRREDRSGRSDTQMNLLMELTMVLILLSVSWCCCS